MTTIRRSSSLSPTGRYDTSDRGKKTGHARDCARGPVIADAANAAIVGVAANAAIVGVAANAAIVCVAANPAINARSERRDQFLAVCFSIS
jgi:hypothetical protein